MSTRLSWHNGVTHNADFEPYLLQVLEKHSYNKNENAELALAAVHDGGDYKPIGKYLSDLVGWHYMGAAEFEFGAIPQAIKYMVANRLDVVRGDFTTPGSKLPLNMWGRQDSRVAKELGRIRKLKRLTKEKKARLAELEKQLGASATPTDLTMYYVGPSEYKPLIPELMEKLCAGKLDTKNGCRFGSIADPIDEYDREYIGWLCVDFPFFLVKDKSVANALALLFTGTVFP